MHPPLRSFPRPLAAGLRRSVTALALGVLFVTLGASGAGVAGAQPAKTPSLSGVTITFGDQLKAYQTVFAATIALNGRALHGGLGQLHRRAAGHCSRDERVGRPGLHGRDADRVRPSRPGTR